MRKLAVLYTVHMLWLLQLKFGSIRLKCDNDDRRGPKAQGQNLPFLRA